jgi:hypothetical protein
MSRLMIIGGSPSPATILIEVSTDCDYGVGKSRRDDIIIDKRRKKRAKP